MKNKKRILAFLAAISLLASGAVYAEYDPEKVVDTSSPITTLSVTEETPYAVNGATVDGVIAADVNGVKMIPLRSVAEGLGYTVTWTGESRSIDLTKGAQFITMSIDKDEYAFSRRAPQALGACPTLVGDLTYVPLTFIDEIIGGYYSENEDGTYKVVNPSIVTVTEIAEDGALTVEDDSLGTVIVYISEETVITAGDAEAAASDIEAGMVLEVEYSAAMTASLPPQTTAVKINIANVAVDVPEVQELAFEGIITEINDNEVTIGDPATDADAIKLIVSDEAVITKGMDRRIYKIDDLAVGMEIAGTHAEAMTMSIPPQSAALTIQILSDIVAE